MVQVPPLPEPAFASWTSSSQRVAAPEVSVRLYYRGVYGLFMGGCVCGWVGGVGFGCTCFCKPGYFIAQDRCTGSEYKTTISGWGVSAFMGGRVGAFVGGWVGAFVGGWQV